MTNSLEKLTGILKDQFVGANMADKYRSKYGIKDLNPAKYSVAFIPTFDG